ncbi:tetratricopeptide repeat protein [Halomonas sp. M4R5S39]|uniref:O-linked N-acetylglucosamine transferase family protein n=1 Tax=Halomonas kalidii TaxID=3043293 RepID=UPI0024A9B8CC|nr:tetratricopeptide repeat protein [Halomonas kalidii]MDI5987288.1 tetratricopeptide repeat protein [Halomonas kalidii]
MAKKNARRRSTTRAPEAGNPLPAAQLSTFDMAFQGGDYPRALRLAEAMVQGFPRSAQARELQANVLGRLERFADAGDAMARVVELVEKPGAAQRLKLAQYQMLAGRAAAAVAALEEIVEAKPSHLTALVWLSRAYHQLGNNRKALEVNDRALALDARHEEVLLWRARILDQLKHHDDALETLERLSAVNPKHTGVQNHIAALHVKEGNYKKAEAHFAKELELDPTNGQVHSNLLMAAHYNPEYSAKDIFAKGLEWDKRFAKPSPSGRANTLKEPAKKLRIGLLSGGFRMHPVGQMLLPALQHLSSEQFEIIAYSTNQLADKLTHDIRQVVHRWQVIEGLSDSQLEQKIRDDGIDILIDMNGAGEGSRYDTLTREPAPLIVKWVGSLINTTGISCFDYLISDAIETPEGIDDYYTEKLIRLPDDYICYHIPEHAPDVKTLPALKNGYVTFGCLNNPAKLSPPMLAEWAVLLHEIPGSKLLLRGVQFESERYRSKVFGTLSEHGISSDRLILEGPAQHREFMATYQRIDIALDTWPYSGGLTTCEALMMGVPVVTRVGPTFAGRHSATHLVNAGLPELVTDSWEDFRKRSRELVNDLPSLAVIRASLRTILMDSPICNGPRFANHLTTALRAIWQRHCEGKAPEALTFSKSGAARFAGEDAPVKLAMTLFSDGFDWQLESPVVAMDNGAGLASRDDVGELLASGRLALLSFDPCNTLAGVHHLAQRGEIQHFPDVTLGDGQPVTLYRRSGEKPTSLHSSSGTEGNARQEQIPSVALDGIEGLPSIDLLVLDDAHDSLGILKHGTEALKDTLVLQAGVRFNPVYANQPELGKVIEWASQHGFRFYCFNNLHYRSHLPDSVPAEKRQATELMSADALFLPSLERIDNMQEAQRIKLAFLLHAVFGIKDIAYSLLSRDNRGLAKKYLADHGVVDGVGKEEESELSVRKEKRKVFVVGFPKSGTSTIQKALEKTGYSSAHWKVEEGYVGELMYRGLEDHDDPWYYLARYEAVTQADVCLPDQGVDCWPNLDFHVIKKIKEKHPDCLFVLNWREPKDTVSSITRWRDLQSRILKSEAPRLPKGVGGDSEILYWIEEHIGRVREFFKDDPNFVEIDISDADAPDVLGDKLGLKLGWWGVANANARNKSVPVPDEPFMSSAEKQLFKAELCAAEHYFEFGSGGSTVWAVKQGLSVKGVESDNKWVFSLKSRLGEKCQVDAVDIGETREWGFPVSMECADKFPSYSLSIHQHQDIFDLILVDGRFRVACTLAAIEHIVSKHSDPGRARIFIHDFWNRSQYHVVLEFLETIERVETAGVFRVKENCDMNGLKKLWKKYSKQPA